MHPKSTGNIAKLLHPTNNNSYRRERLLNMLDEWEKQRAIWVAAPAGSGKTTLIASYLEERNVPSIWYQIDEGDTDVASFFYYLGIAEQKLNAGKFSTLPRLTPEYQHSLAIFARNYFRELFGRIEDATLLIFDNYQDAAEDCPLHKMVEILLDEIPSHVQAIILSRAHPPTELSRRSLSPDFSLLDWQQFKLNKEESLDIIKHESATTLTKEQQEKIVKLAQGWMAGLILLLKQAGSNIAVPETQHISSYKEIFGYFTNEIFNVLDTDAQQVLLLTALFPSFTMDMAKCLTDQDHADTVIIDLFKDQFFVSQHADLVDSYEYHPLFREFLSSRLHSTFHQDMRIGKQHLAARLLAENEQYEDAANLYIQIQDWLSVASLVIQQAQGLIDQGRYQTLQRWIENIPDDIQSDNPWLPYWLGKSYLAVDPHRARRDFERAFALFQRAQMQEGELLSWSGIIDSIVNSWDDYTPLNDWINQFEQYYTPSSAFINDDIEGRVTASMVSALMICQPNNKNIAQWLDRLLACRSTDFNIKLSVYIFSIYYFVWTGNYNKCYALMDELKSIVTHNDVTPLAMITARWIEAAWLDTNGENILQSINNILEYADRTGIMLWQHMLYAVAAEAALTLSDIPTAEHYIDKLETTLLPSRQHGYSLYHYLKGWKYYLRKDYQPALTHAQRAYEIAASTGYVFASMLCRLAMINILIRQENYAQSRQYLDDMITPLQATGSAYILFSFYLTEANWHRSQRNLEGTCTALRSATRLGKKQGIFGLLWWWTLEELGQLCACALAHAIESDYVRQFINKRNLVPPQTGSFPFELDWPWPVKIYTLGSFNVIINGDNIDATKKGSVRYLELLKALIAHGGREVNEQTLTDDLWSGSDGDQAKQNLKATLHRLRKLFRGHEVVTLKHKQLSLNSRLCWVDTWEVSDLFAKVDQVIARRDGYDDCTWLLERLCQYYHAPFLNGEDANWLFGMREQLHSRFTIKVESLSRYLERAGHIEPAIQGYYKLLEVAPRTEEAYQGLMRCYKAQGKQAKAIALYQQCKARLNEALGIEPSEETQALYQAILDAKDH